MTTVFTYYDKLICSLSHKSSVKIYYDNIKIVLYTLLELYKPWGEKASSIIYIVQMKTEVEESREMVPETEPEHISPRAVCHAKSI